MPFDQKQLAIEIRNMLSEGSPALVGLPLPRIYAILPPAVDQYARASFMDARKRQQFKKRINATLVNGQLDLTPFTDGTTSRIYLPEMSRITIYLTATNRALTWVGSREQLDYAQVGSMDSPMVFLDGYILQTRDHLSGLVDALNEDIYFTVPTIPVTIADLPGTLQRDFIVFVAQFVRNQLGGAPAQGVTA